MVTVYLIEFRMARVVEVGEAVHITYGLEAGSDVSCINFKHG